MKKGYTAFITSAVLICAAAVFYSACAPSKPEPVKVGGIAEGTIDPEEWGKVYPLHYESWLKTTEPKPKNKSRYRKGWDTDKVIYDRLSEYPFAALLYKGWGFGVEYNEPRGHFYAVIDQIEIDPSRVKPGGVCLACKNPHHKPLVEKHGLKYLTMPFLEALNMMPEKERKLGPSCIDCHKPADMDLTTNKPHLDRGFAMIGKTELSRQEKRTAACAQCHITYYVPRDKDKKVNADVNLPWTGAKWGGITIEHIVKDLLSDISRIEWKQEVTGFDMPFIRHPEFELFTNKSTHFNAGVSCADCHMPYTRTGAYKISDHDVTSPLKREMRACVQCHTESSEWLREQVNTTQDRTTSLLLRGGYGTAVAAKLFELTHKHEAAGKKFDRAMYDAAKKNYMEAFLRVVFIGAENSTGFHNPSEAMRVLGDAVAFASKSENLLRQMLTKAGVDVPVDLNLELAKYLNGRGKHKLNFKADQEVKDPFGTQDRFTPKQSRGI
jgi:nitrite reductase (cytochrome c-552)